jgi:predicted GNAT family acetyltransferase
VDNPERQRYEVYQDDTLAGFAEYRLRDGAIALTHTETDPAFAGQGLASALVRHALDKARDQGLSVVPFCWFVRDYIDKHRDYLDLVPTDQRERFEL